MLGPSLVPNQAAPVQLARRFLDKLKPVADWRRAPAGGGFGPVPGAGPAPPFPGGCCSTRSEENAMRRSFDDSTGKNLFIWRLPTAAAGQH